MGLSINLDMGMRQDWLSDLRDWTRSLREDKMVGRRKGGQERESESASH